MRLLDRFLRIGIVTGGSEYRVGEELEFNNDNTGGGKVTARISKLKGRFCQ